jgi:hypothetical protein
MGTTVLDAGPPQPRLHLYAQCLRGHAGGVTLLAINTSRTKAKSIDLPTEEVRYTLTSPQSPTLKSTRVQLNGRTLRLGAHNALPDLRGQRVPAGRVELQPASITFLTVPGASNKNCKVIPAEAGIQKTEP